MHITRLKLYTSCKYRSMENIPYIRVCFCLPWGCQALLSFVFVINNLDESESLFTPDTGLLQICWGPAWTSFPRWWTSSTPHTFCWLSQGPLSQGPLPGELPSKGSCLTREAMSTLQRWSITDWLGPTVSWPSCFQAGFVVAFLPRSSLGAQAEARCDVSSHHAACLLSLPHPASLSPHCLRAPLQYIMHLNPYFRLCL